MLVITCSPRFLHSNFPNLSSFFQVRIIEVSLLRPPPFLLHPNPQLPRQLPSMQPQPLPHPHLLPSVQPQLLRPHPLVQLQLPRPHPSVQPHLNLPRKCLPVSTTLQRRIRTPLTPSVFEKISVKTTENVYGNI